MDQVQVNIVQSHVAEGSPTRHLDVLLGMVGVPQLGRDKELLTGADPGIDSTPALQFN